jgi:hypothetical protein
MDRHRMRETGRRLADGHLKDPPLLASKVTCEPAASDGFTGEEGLDQWRVRRTNAIEI